MAVITQEYLNAIKQYEGGLASAKTDPASANPSSCGINPKDGNPWHTNRGVTWSSFVALAPKLGYTADCATFMAMPDDIWAKIFKQGYWNPIQLDNVNSNGVAYLLADFSWGSGTGYVPPFLRNFLQTNYNVSAADTTSQVNALNTLTATNEQDVIQKLSAARLASLQSMKGGTLFATYGAGWTNRLNGLTSLAMSMVGKVEAAATAAVGQVKKHPYVTIAITAAVIVTLYLVLSKTSKSTQAA